MSLVQFKNTQFALPHKTIIHDLSLDIAQDDFVVILGGNGSGKSTLLKLLTQTYRHTSGSILLQKNYC